MRKITSQGNILGRVSRNENRETRECDMLEGGSCGQCIVREQSNAAERQEVSYPSDAMRHFPKNVSRRLMLYPWE